MLGKRAYYIIIVWILGLSTCTLADHAFAHTHVGKNPTWCPANWDNPSEGAVDLDPTDDNKLWFFSLPPVSPSATPGWPYWEHVNGNTFLVLTPVKEGREHITKPGDPNKELYTCNFTYSKAGGYGDPNGFQHLDGWHSAHGPQGAWNLESVDANTIPAWGLHEHMSFYFWLDEEDDEIYVVFSAHDAGGMYQRSADCIIRFAKTVYQPIPGDLNNDGIVDVSDFDILVEHWGQSGIYSGEDLEPHDHDHDVEPLKEESRS